MEKERQLVIVAVVAVIIASVTTFFVSPSRTTLPIPEPGNRTGNNTGAGIQVIARNLEVPWAIDIASDGRVFLS